MQSTFADAPSWTQTFLTNVNMAACTMPSQYAFSTSAADIAINDVLATPEAALPRLFGQEPCAARVILMAPMSIARRRTAVAALLKLFPHSIPAELFAALGGFIHASSTAAVFARKLQTTIDTAERSHDAREITQAYIAAAAAIGTGWTTTALAPGLQVNLDYVWRYFACAHGCGCEPIAFRANAMAWFAKQQQALPTYQKMYQFCPASNHVEDDDTAVAVAQSMTPGQIAICSGLHTRRCRGIATMLHAAAIAAGRATTTYPASAEDDADMHHALTIVHLALMHFPFLMNMDSGCARSCACTLQCAWRVAHIVAAHARPTAVLWSMILDAYQVAPARMANVIRNAFQKHPDALDETMLAVLPKLCCMAAADGSPFVHPDASLIPDVIAHISARAPIFVDIATRLFQPHAAASSGAAAVNIELMSAFATLNADAPTVSELLRALALLPFLFDTIAVRLLTHCFADWSSDQLQAAVADGTAFSMASSARVCAACKGASMPSSTRPLASRWSKSPGVARALDAGWGPAFFFTPAVSTPLLLMELSLAAIAHPADANHLVSTFEHVLCMCEHLSAELAEDVLLRWYERHGAQNCCVASPVGRVSWFRCMAHFAHMPDLLTQRMLYIIVPLNGTSEFIDGCCCGDPECRAFVSQVHALQRDDHACMLRLLCVFSSCWGAHAWECVREYAFSPNAHSATEDWLWARTQLGAYENAGPATAAMSNLPFILNYAARMLPTKHARALPLAAIEPAACILVRTAALLNMTNADTAVALRAFIAALAQVPTMSGNGHRAFFVTSSSAAVSTTLTLLELAHAVGLQLRDATDWLVLQPLYTHAWMLSQAQTSVAGYASYAARLCELNTTIELAPFWLPWTISRAANRIAHPDRLLLFSCFKSIQFAPSAALLQQHASSLVAWLDALTQSDHWLHALQFVYPICVHIMCALVPMTPVHIARTIVQTCARLVSFLDEVDTQHNVGVVLNCVLTGAADGAPLTVPPALMLKLLEPLREAEATDSIPLESAVIVAVHGMVSFRPAHGVADHTTLVVMWALILRALVHTGIKCIDTLALVHAAATCTNVFTPALSHLAALEQEFGGEWQLPSFDAAAATARRLLSESSNHVRMGQAFRVAAAVAQETNLPALRELACAFVAANIPCAAAAAMCLDDDAACARLIQCVYELKDTEALLACCQAARRLSEPTFVSYLLAHADSTPCRLFYQHMLAAGMNEMLLFICLHMAEMTSPPAAMSSSTPDGNGVISAGTVDLRLAALASIDAVAVATYLCAHPITIQHAVRTGLGDALHWLVHEVKAAAPAVSEELHARCAAAAVPVPAALPECAICFECTSPFTQTHDMPCTHMFHVKCLAQWLNTRPSDARTCPMCRAHCSDTPHTRFEHGIRAWQRTPLRMLLALQGAPTELDGEDALASAIQQQTQLWAATHLVFDDTSSASSSSSENEEA